MNPPDPPTHHAILLGIDDYKQKPLESCVRDVEQIQAFLETTLSGLVGIHLLTAKRQDQNSAQRTGYPTRRPTLSNLMNVLDEVVTMAQPGNYLYLHFSGHGTREVAELNSHQTTERSAKDFGIVLLGEEGQDHDLCLWGRDLALQIKRLTDCGLIVTLVLDCCFSGAVDRDSSDIRYIPYSPGMEPDLQHVPEQELIQQAEYSTNRDISMLPNWLLNPKDHTILTACGPSETTVGTLADGKPCGALSYFLLETLVYLGLTKMQRIVFGRVCAKLKANSRLSKQHPVLYGNLNQPFFGPSDKHSSMMTIPVIRTAGKTLELQAGYVHGLNLGDELILFPTHMDHARIASEGSALAARIIKNNAFTSVLELQASSNASVRTGWSAAVIMASRLSKLPIRLPDKFQTKERWATAMKQRSLTIEKVSTENDFAFEICLTQNHGIEILDESGQRFGNLPLLSQNELDIDKICDVLEHLARFRLVRELANHDTPTDLQQSVAALVISNGISYQAGETPIELAHGSLVTLSVTNKGDLPFYIFVLNLGPFWKIENILKGTSSTCLPQRKWTNRLLLKVPEKPGIPSLDSCQDILKIIITSHPTSLDLIELGDIWDQQSTKRLYRNDHEKPATQEAWTALSFVFQTSKQNLSLISR